MKIKSLCLPFYLKASIVLIGLYVLFSILVILQNILLPFIYAIFISILLSPAINFLAKKNINRTFAIILVLLFFILLLSGIIAIIISQAGYLDEAFPILKTKFIEISNNSISWLSYYLGLPEAKINQWIVNIKEELGANSEVIIGNTLSLTMGFLTTIVLVPVYVFMLLIYQNHFLNSIHRIFGFSNDEKVDEVLSETKTIIQSYVVGLFTEIIIVAVLNVVGLLLLGINYAILLGLCAALLNIIPYLGGVITMFLFMLVALVTKEPVYIIYVVALYSFIQFIDNNFLVPKIIGSKVKLNALVSLLAVILGAALWGIPGMFLFIPLIAILKVILDKIESLKSWGYLLGYD